MVLTPNYDEIILKIIKSIAEQLKFLIIYMEFVRFRL